MHSTQPKSFLLILITLISLLHLTTATLLTVGPIPRSTPALDDNKYYKIDDNFDFDYPA